MPPAEEEAAKHTYLSVSSRPREVKTLDRHHTAGRRPRPAPTLSNLDSRAPPLCALRRSDSPKPRPRHAGPAVPTRSPTARPPPRHLSSGKPSAHRRSRSLLRDARPSSGSHGRVSPTAHPSSTARLREHPASMRGPHTDPADSADPGRGLGTFRFPGRCWCRPCAVPSGSRQPPAAI